MKTINFINLTNGIEAIKQYNLKDYQFIRIQSSVCESKNWVRFFENIDDNFLMNLAMGNRCVIYDYSAHKNIPRALYQGIAFLEYCLERKWFGRETPITIRNQTYYTNPFYENAYRKVFREQKLRKKIRYFRKFLNTNKLNIEIISDRTELDGKNDVYRDILYEK